MTRRVYPIVEKTDRKIFASSSNVLKLRQPYFLPPLCAAERGDKRSDVGVSRHRHALAPMHLH